MEKLIVILKKAKTNMSLFFDPIPEEDEDYADKVVRLLRRDFDTETQNQILLSIGKKLSEAREKDMRKMEEEYELLQKCHANLNSRIAYQ
jgi:hypothetical protein